MKFTNKKLLSGSILLLAATLFLLINIGASLFLKAVNLDLTANKLYTLSNGTKEILADLKEPIILKFYFSKKLSKTNPYMLSFADRVHDLLVQYQRAAKGKVILEFIDPEPFSSAEDEALALGLQGLPVDNTGVEFYLGLIGTNSVNTRVIIPFMQPNREINLEYDISQLIYRLANPQVKTIGVISSIPIQTKENRPWAIWQQISQSFQLKQIDTDTNAIPDNISTLMIVDPSRFSSTALKAIDRFVMRGGNLIAFVDPYVEVGDKSLSSDEFKNLLTAWGVKLEDKIVADRTNAKNIRIQNNNSNVTVRYPLWIDFSGKNFDKKDVLTASLERITMASPGALSKVAGAESTYTPLINTSKDAMLVDPKDMPGLQKKYDEFMKNYQPSGAYTVAARISGPVKSAYAEDSTLKSNILVIADVDMLHDHFWLNISNVMGQQVGVPVAANGNFVLSALENLTGSNSLISVRNRGGFARPFEAIQHIESRSQNKYRETEQHLQQKLEVIKRNLAEIETQKQSANKAQLSLEQKQQLLSTRRELRDVRRKLNNDIENLQLTIKFVSIWFIPSLIILTWLMFLGYRRVTCSIPKR